VKIVRILQGQKDFLGFKTTKIKIKTNKKGPEQLS